MGLLNMPDSHEYLKLTIFGKCMLAFVLEN
jgi:hypothetical protein